MMKRFSLIGLSLSAMIGTASATTPIGVYGDGAAFTVTKTQRLQEEETKSFIVRGFVNNKFDVRRDFVVTFDCGPESFLMVKFLNKEWMMLRKNFREEVSRQPMVEGFYAIQSRYCR